MSKRPQPRAAISPEMQRLIDDHLDRPRSTGEGGGESGPIDQLALTNPAVMAELDAQRSVIAAIRGPVGRIDVTDAVLSAVHSESPFVEIERRQRRARRRTALCVSVVLAVGGLAVLQAMYPELSDFGAGQRPISTLTEAGHRDVVDGAQAMASAVGTITKSLVEPGEAGVPRRHAPRRAALGLGDTSNYDPKLSWELTSAWIAPSDARPLTWLRPCGESISVAWQAPANVTIRDGDLPASGVTWVGGWRQDVPGLSVPERHDAAPRK